MSLKVWLPLNKDLTNNGSSGVVVTNNGVTFSGGCANFNGSSNYISCGNPNIDGGKVSAACWVYMNTLSGANYLISLNNAGGYGDQEIGLSVESGYIYFLAGGNMSLVSQNIQINTWTHLAVTFDGNTITGYVNGVSIGSISHATKLNRTYLTIGARHNGSNTYIYFGNCKMFDTRIYDHCLSQKEVSELARGLVAHYKLDGIAEDFSYTECTNATSYLNLPYDKKDFRYKIKFSFVRDNVNARYNNKVMDVQGGTIMVYTYNTSDVFYNRVKPQYWSSATLAQHISSNDLPYIEYGRIYEAELSYINNVVTAYIDGNFIYSYTDTNYLTDRGIYLFNDVIHTNGSYSRIYNAKVYSGATDNTIVYDLIPYEDSSTHYGGFVDTLSNNTWTTSGLEFGYELIYGVGEKICDYSGMGNHGIINGTISLDNNTPRYNKCANLINSFITIPFQHLPETTIAFWINRNTLTGTRQFIYTGWAGISIELTASNGWQVYYTYNSSYATVTCNPTTILEANKWYHIALVIGRSGVKAFCNGVLENTATYQTPYYSPSTAEIGNYSTYHNFNAKLSDFRIYSTALSDADITNLYRDSLSINNLQGSTCWEYVENDTMLETSPADVKKTGVVKAKKLSEAIVSFYDKETYVEPDGSVWIRIFHHNNPSTGLFSSGDTFTTKVYKDDNRWFQMSVCNYVTKWELMVKQKTTSGSTELKGRWIQNANPMTATHDEVTTNRITINTSPGYSNFSSGICGIICRGTSYYSYICQTTDSGSGWWGGIGEFTAYNGGIERFALQGASGQVTTGYLDLYLRIDNLDDITLARIGKEGLISDTITEL